MKGETDAAEFFVEWGIPGIFILLGILIIIFRKALAKLQYLIMKAYGEVLKDEKGESWGLVKTLTPGCIKDNDEIGHQKLMLWSGVLSIIMGIFAYFFL